MVSSSASAVARRGWPSRGGDKKRRRIRGRLGTDGDGEREQGDERCERREERRKKEKEREREKERARRARTRGAGPRAATECGRGTSVRVDGRGDDGGCSEGNRAAMALAASPSGPFRGSVLPSRTPGPPLPPLRPFFSSHFPSLRPSLRIAHVLVSPHLFYVRRTPRCRRRSPPPTHGPQRRRAASALRGPDARQPRLGPRRFSTVSRPHSHCPIPVT